MGTRLQSVPQSIGWVGDCQAVDCEVWTVTVEKLGPVHDCERCQWQHWFSCLSRVGEEAGAWGDVQTIIFIPHSKGSSSFTGRVGERCCGLPCSVVSGLCPCVPLFVFHPDRCLYSPSFPLFLAFARAALFLICPPPLYTHSAFIDHLLHVQRDSEARGTKTQAHSSVAHSGRDMQSIKGSITQTQT